MQRCVLRISSVCCHLQKSRYHCAYYSIKPQLFAIQRQMSSNSRELQTDQISVQYAESHWYKICSKLLLSDSLALETWNILLTRYSEKQRHYHTMEHIYALLRHSIQLERLIQDILVVDLAIYFHDIVYDPKSKTNEEDSAVLFEALLSPHLDPNQCEKVRHYIIATKKHDVSSSQDNDLKLFIDIDMSILGVSVEQYERYARQIRQEYSFVPEADYCSGRAAVLLSFIAPHNATPNRTNSTAQSSTEASAEDNAAVPATERYIFATELFRTEREAQARSNLSWECAILQSGRLV